MGSCMEKCLQADESSQDDVKIFLEISFDDCPLSKIQQRDITTFPYNTIGSLIAETTSKKLVFGTGVLISSDIVLTCVHNIFNSTTQKSLFYYEFLRLLNILSQFLR